MMMVVVMVAAILFHYSFTLYFHLNLLENEWMYKRKNEKKNKVYERPFVLREKLKFNVHGPPSCARLWVRTSLLRFVSFFFGQIFLLTILWGSIARIRVSNYTFFTMCRTEVWYHFFSYMAIWLGRCLSRVFMCMMANYRIKKHINSKQCRL